VTLYSREYWYRNEDYNCVFNFSEQFINLQDFLSVLHIRIAF